MVYTIQYELQEQSISADIALQINSMLRSGLMQTPLNEL